MEEGYADYRKYVNGLSFITNNLALALVSSLLELYQGTGSSLVHHFEQPFAPNQRIQFLANCRPSARSERAPPPVSLLSRFKTL